MNNIWSQFLGEFKDHQVEGILNAKRGWDRNIRLDESYGPKLLSYIKTIVLEKAKDNMVLVRHGALNPRKFNYIPIALYSMLVMERNGIWDRLEDAIKTPIIENIVVACRLLDLGGIANSLLRLHRENDLM